MDFEWDKVKASTNQKKHGIPFIEASEVFNGQLPRPEGRGLWWLKSQVWVDQPKP